MADQTDTTFGLVQGQLLALAAQGTQLVNGALQQIDEITQFPASAPSLNLDNSGYIGGFGTVDTEMLQDPETIAEFDLPELPELDEFNPKLPSAPSVPAGAPNVPPTPGNPNYRVEFPDEPVLVNPDAPTLLDPAAPGYVDYTGQLPPPRYFEVTLPPVPTLRLDEITFEGQRPVYSGPELDYRDFQFENREYAPLLVNEIKGVILSIFNGGSGLPAAVEDALFERARERESEDSSRAEMQAREEHASRGFKYPAGPLMAKIARVRRDAEKRLSQLSRDQFIEHWRIHIEQLRAAMQNGIALEEVWLRQFVSAEDRRLQAARLALDLSIAVVNAYVSRLNAEAIVYQTDATVYRERLQGELAKVQVYAEQLRGQEIIGNLNENEVRLLTARVGALQGNVTIFEAFIRAYEAQFRANETKVNVWRGQLGANRDKVDLFEAQLRAVSTEISGETEKTNRFRVMADIMGTQANIWKTKFDVNRDVFNGEIEIERLRRDNAQLSLERVRTILQGEQTRVGALRDKYASTALMSEAKSRVITASAEVKIREFLAELEETKAKLELGLKEGEINVQSMLTFMNLVLRGKETAAQTYAALAAGVTSAANVDASISAGSSFSAQYTIPNGT